MNDHTYEQSRRYIPTQSASMVNRLRQHQSERKQLLLILNLHLHAAHCKCRIQGHISPNVFDRLKPERARVLSMRQQQSESVQKKNIKIIECCKFQYKYWYFMEFWEVLRVRPLLLKHFGSVSFCHTCCSRSSFDHILPSLQRDSQLVKRHSAKLINVLASGRRVRRRR